MAGEKFLLEQPVSRIRGYAPAASWKRWCTASARGAWSTMQAYPSWANDAH